MADQQLPLKVPHSDALLSTPRRIAARPILQPKSRALLLPTGKPSSTIANSVLITTHGAPTSLPSVLDPTVHIQEKTYAEATEEMNRNAGPLLPTLKLPSRPVDIVLYSPVGGVLMISNGGLVLDEGVTLVHLVTWLQMFVDIWSKKEKYKDPLIVNGLEIRGDLGTTSGEKRYPSIKGVPFSGQIENSEDGIPEKAEVKIDPAKEAYVMTWKIRGDMEAYWEVYRNKVQLGGPEQIRVPIFKVSTLKMLRNKERDDLAVKQYGDAHYFDVGDVGLIDARKYFGYDGGRQIKELEQSVEQSLNRRSQEFSRAPVGQIGEAVPGTQRRGGHQRAEEAKAQKIMASIMGKTGTAGHRTVSAGRYVTPEIRRPGYSHSADGYGPAMVFNSFSTEACQDAPALSQEIGFPKLQDHEPNMAEQELSDMQPTTTMVPGSKIPGGVDPSPYINWVKPNTSKQAILLTQAQLARLPQAIAPRCSVFDAIKLPDAAPGTVNNQHPANNANTTQSYLAVDAKSIQSPQTNEVVGNKAGLPKVLEILKALEISKIPAIDEHGPSESEFSYTTHDEANFDLVFPSEAVAITQHDASEVGLIEIAPMIANVGEQDKNDGSLTTSLATHGRDPTAIEKAIISIVDPNVANIESEGAIAGPTPESVATPIAGEDLFEKPRELPNAILRHAVKINNMPVLISLPAEWIEKSRRDFESARSFSEEDDDIFFPDPSARGKFAPITKTIAIATQKRLHRQRHDQHSMTWPQQVHVISRPASPARPASAMNINAQSFYHSNLQPVGNHSSPTSSSPRSALNIYAPSFEVQKNGGYDSPTPSVPFHSNLPYQGSTPYRSDSPLKQVSMANVQNHFGNTNLSNEALGQPINNSHWTNNFQGSGQGKAYVSGALPFNFAPQAQDERRYSQRSAGTESSGHVSFEGGFNPNTFAPQTFDFGFRNNGN